MDNIGIIVALQSELELLLHHITETETITISTGKIIRGHMGGKRVSVLQCGIGKVNAAIGTTLLITHCSPDCIINTGVAGGTGSQASVLDVVVGDNVAYHDVWCGEPNQYGQVQGLPHYFAASPELLAAAQPLLGEHVMQGLIASGDMFVEKADVLKGILGNYPAMLAVDMESGAIAQTCHVFGVPFMALRVVSDTPGAADNASQYRDFWSLAPKSTFALLTSLIQRL